MGPPCVLVPSDPRDVEVGRPSGPGPEAAGGIPVLHLRIGVAVVVAAAGAEVAVAMALVADVVAAEPDKAFHCDR